MQQKVTSSSRLAGNKVYLSDGSWSLTIEILGFALDDGAGSSFYCLCNDA